MSNQPPIGVPQGAIRLNTDSQKLEFYAHDQWFEMATDVPTLVVLLILVVFMLVVYLNQKLLPETQLRFLTIPVQGNTFRFW